MEEFMSELKVPKDRIAVLIGKSGEVKKQIEESTNTKLEIDSAEGDVFITGKDGLEIFSAKQVTKAVGRGFNPDIAMLLLKQDYSLEVIDMNEFAKNKANLMRLKGRVIGKDGKARKTIEQLTECYISVSGKTIGIIGKVENAQNAKRAVGNLLKGAQHANTFRWLENQRRQLKQKELEERSA